MGSLNRLRRRPSSIPSKVPALYSLNEMPSKLETSLRHPIQAAAFAYAFVARAFLVVAARLLLVGAPRYQSLRTELQRAYLSSASLNFSDLVFCLPAEYPPSRAFPLDGSGWKGYLVLGGRGAVDWLHAARDDKSFRIVLFAHGGGYARGTARMYTPYLERWVVGAEKMGFRLMFLSVEYTLSTYSPHPQQRTEFLSAYRYLLDLGIDPSQILFMGDSAGGGICVNSAIRAQKEGMPQPRGSVLVSPWLDVAGESLRHGSPTVTSDYFVQANTAVPVLAKMFRGTYQANDPDVNSLHAADVDLKGLNPQLIFAGAAEFALYDSQEWARVCMRAGVHHELHVEWGQLHIWAMGSAWIEPGLRQKTDTRILTWMQNCS